MYHFVFVAGFSRKPHNSVRINTLHYRTPLQRETPFVFTPVSVEMFTKTGVYTEKELIARNEVKWETYVKKVQIESRVMVRMAINHIIPATVAYKADLMKELALAQKAAGRSS